MALAHAILALVACESISGYDLTKAFEGTVGCFWKATHQQIYRELGLLEERGALEAEVVEQQGRPNKKLYRLTEGGKEVLKDWIAGESTPSTIREDLLVKIFAGHLVAPEILLVELERHREMHGQKLLHYQQIEQKFPEQLSLMDQFTFLTLRRGLRLEADWIAWCDEAISIVRQMQLPGHTKQ
jgi:DNA-binding PadR family transcriptional regulator